MFSLKSLLLLAVSFALTIAQSTPNIAFSFVPAVAVAGNTYNITWGGGDGTSVTLTLRKGSPSNLDTIAIIASRVTGSSYLWTVSTDLATGSDYALQIQQGLNGINYSGLFSIVGGTGTSSISYSGLSTATANATVITTGVISTRASTITTASMGTGTSISRNTTFSPQTLSSTSTITTAATTRAATTVSQSTSAPTGNSAASMGSSAALVMGLFGAIMFLQ